MAATSPSRPNPPSKISLNQNISKLSPSLFRATSRASKPDALRVFCYAGDMGSSLDKFVLIKASKSHGGVWSDDDYIVRDRARNVVVGRIMLHPQAPEAQPWFWTITAREQPPSVYNHGYAVSREQAMRYFKARWLTTIN
jgi:hypothetical protein